MSCEKNNIQALKGGLVNGITAVANKGAYSATRVAMAAAGAVSSGKTKVEAAARPLVEKAEQTGRRVREKNEQARHRVAGKIAPATNKVVSSLQAADSYGLGSFVKGAAVGAGQTLQLAGRLEKAGVPMGAIVRVANGLGQFRSLPGNLASDASRKNLAATVVQTRPLLRYFNMQEAVNLWHSRLTPSLNGRDRLSVGEKVLSSTGVMVKADQANTTWHRGTSVVQMPDGEKRTLTHLQSLALPSQHYYFDRRLSHEETAGVVTGQRGYRPEDMSGYIGQVGPAEGLTRWGTAKHLMLKMRIYYPGGQPPGERPPRRLRNMRPLNERDGQWVGRQAARYGADRDPDLKTIKNFVSGRRPAPKGSD